MPTPPVTSCRVVKRRTTRLEAPERYGRLREDTRVASTKKLRYRALRPHAARIAKLAEYPVHVNGAYMDDPEHIPLFDRSKPSPEA